MRRFWHLFVRVAFLAAVLVRLRARPSSGGDRDAAPVTAALRATPWIYWVALGGALAAVVMIGGAVVMISGLVSIKASAGHWGITEALLQFGKRRSVATHALGTKVPPLGDPALALRGAGYYEIGCQPCHGSPALPQPRIAHHMLPRPPYLPQTVHRYDAAELFQLVKHGIKLTGMPAWPSQRRDDEVWAMVAFLQNFSAMSAQEYQRLAHGTVPAGESVPIEELSGGAAAHTVTHTCSRCHGRDGLGRGIGAFPKIAGQRAGYLHATLGAYASGARHSGIMEPIAAALDSSQLRAIAEYYARLARQETQEIRRSALTANTADQEARNTSLGERIATHGVAEQDIPACVTCHGPGQPRPNPNYPALAGQYAGYLSLQLEIFRSENRGGTAYEHIMRNVARRLTPEQIEAVTQYYASLPWTGAAGPR